MPLVAFAKQRFDPHFAFVESLLVGEGLLIPFHAVQILGEKGTMDMPTPVAFGTIGFHRASIAGGRIRTVLHLLCPFHAVRSTQHLTLGAVILIMDGVIGELSKSIVARALASFSQGDVSP